MMIFVDHLLKHNWIKIMIIDISLIFLSIVNYFCLFLCFCYKIFFCSLRHFRCISSGPYVGFHFGRRGEVKLILESGAICMARSAMLGVAKPRVLRGGIGGILPRENFLKMVQFGAFWSIFCCNFVQ